MATARKRRVVRRAVMALAVMVLLLAWYVGSYLVWGWMKTQPSFRVRFTQYVPRVVERSMWRPIARYRVSDLPFSQQFLMFDMWCRSGCKASRRSCRAMADQLRDMERRRRENEA